MTITVKKDLVLATSNTTPQLPQQDDFYLYLWISFWHGSRNITQILSRDLKHAVLDFCPIILKYGDYSLHQNFWFQKS